MADVDLPADLAAFDYHFQGIRYPPYTSRVTWPLPLAGEQNTARTAPHQHNADASLNTMKRSTTPLPSHAYHQPIDQQQQLPTQIPDYLGDWQIPQQQGGQLAYPLHTPFAQDAGYTQSFANDYDAIPFQTSPTDYMSAQGPYDSNLPLEASYVPLTGQLDNSIPFGYQDFSNNLLAYSVSNGVSDVNLPFQNLPNSPTVTSRSLSSSDNGWTSIDFQHPPMDGSFQDIQMGTIFNPEQTLHERTLSDSSYSDLGQQSRHSWGSYVDVPQHAVGSPGSDTGDNSGLDLQSPYLSNESTSPIIKQEEKPSRPMIMTSSTVKPIRIKTSSSPQRSPTFTGRISPPGRRQSKKNSGKAVNRTIRRPSFVPKLETEKKVGRRKGPLRPEQRKQAGEIRKLGACIRCKFLKKTCDKGEPCEGCQPSHARLWQVPCTRIDIKEIAYFMKDWKADYERHISLSFSISNIKGFAKAERTLFITHGYGHMLPIQAREVFVRDERCFGLDWVETVHTYPSEHSVNTAKLSAGVEGISRSILHEYLDQHIDGGFEAFVDEYFDGTPFLTPMLKTAYRFWLLEKTPVIRKSLKLLLAYNLTQHVTMVEGIPLEEGFLGRIDDPTSRFFGKTVAPVMINFEIKCAMAELWRELQREILEELSQLYSSVYTKDKLRHWPTIFMVASILLAVWEEMQFDCHYRIPDREVVNKFCHDMESTPVGVIVGLFSAISQKLPSFQDWDTHKHHNLLGSNKNVCSALTEVRQHVTRHDRYLRTRHDTTFDRDDFDSLSSKFTSKLVIRASAC